MNVEECFQRIREFSEAWRAHYIRAITWLLCWKHSPFLQQKVDKNVALAIAKLLRPNLNEKLVVGNVQWEFWPCYEGTGEHKRRALYWMQSYTDHASLNYICPKCLCPTIMKNGIYSWCFKHGCVASALWTNFTSEMLLEFKDSVILPT